MNRIEAKLERLKKENRKAFITYMMAGLPDIAGTRAIIEAQEEAGTDILELGIPFSDPAADGPVIQNASYRAIQNGIDLRKCFAMMEQVRKKSQIPIIFMMYYNTISYYGAEEFVKTCVRTGVDGVIVPDLPLEEQETLLKALKKTEGAPLFIQLVSPVSKQRIPMIVERAEGFLYCVSSMGVTGQGAQFHKDIVEYLRDVKKRSKVPVMMGFGIRTAKDIETLKDEVDGVIVGSHLISYMEECAYNLEKIKEYIRHFQKELNG